MSGRRTKAEIEAIKGGLYEIVEEFQPMTVRQVFYQAVSRGLIDKKESEYHNAISRLLTRMRKDGDMPWQWIADTSRWMRKPQSFDNMQDMLEDSIDLYRRALWRDQSDYVEVWLEKEALSGVMYPITAQWDVPLMVTRGYPSFTYLAQAAEAILHQVGAHKRPHLYYFGDHDPSGVDIPRHVESEINRIIARRLAHPGVSEESILCDAKFFDFTRVAVNPDQIVDLDLQTRPTKGTDTRARDFEGESVEVDAIHPETLREIAEGCITQHINDGLMQNTLQIERQERETLRQMAESTGI